MIGYNFGLGFMPGPFCFGALSWVVLLLLLLLEASCQMRSASGAVSFFLDRP